MNIMSVYQPSDDSELLLEAIVNLKNNTVLEIGVGSGIILQSLSSNNDSVVGVDINQESLDFAISYLKKLNLHKNVDLILGDGPTMFDSQIFDLIIFNPPYLPHDDYTDRTTDGGKTGLELTIKWLELSLNLIKNTGKIIFLQSNLTPIDEYLETLSKSFSVNILHKKKIFFEELYIIEVMHNK